MSLPKELVVVLKDSERSYRQKFLTYEDLALSADHPTIKQSIEEARKNFDGEPEEVQIKIKMIV